MKLFDAEKQRGELADRTDPELCARNVFAIYVDAITAFVGAERPDRRQLGSSFEDRIDALLSGALARSQTR